jgi:predicted RNase H-like HicB family nuclease
MRPFIAFIRKQPGSGFGVCFPDLPHCNSTGRTIDEARQNAEYALGLHWRRMRDTGKGTPVPSYMHELPWSAEEIANGLVMLITPQARAV